MHNGTIYRICHQQPSAHRSVGSHIGSTALDGRAKGGHAVSPAIATQMINKEDAVVVDIRTKKEWDTGHITGAKHIPLADLARRIEELNKYKTKPIIVVCNIGQTAGSASKQLKEAGFENVSRLQGGITEWKGQNLPIIKKGK